MPMLRRKALTAVAAKMARVAYALAKRLEPYRGYHEQALQQAALDPQKKGFAVRVLKSS